MEISARPLRQYPLDPNYHHDDYEVLIDGHKILTLETHGQGMVARWLFDSARRPNTRSDGYVVSLAVERERVTYNKRGVADTPYDLLTVCIGSHCLIFHIPDPKEKYSSYKFDPTSLRTFFDHQSVTVVGRGMKAVAEKLDRDFGIKIMKWFDLNELAVRAMRREDLDLAKYDLDRLARTVLGKRFDVVRDEEPVDWYDYNRKDYYYYYLPLSVDKVKFATVDTYLSFMIGTKLLEMIRSPPPDPISASRLEWDKKKKKKKQSEKKKKKKRSSVKNKQ